MLRGLGPWLKILRGKLDFNQTEMADLLGLVRESVGAIETEKTEMPRGDTLWNLLDFCGYGSEEELQAAIDAGKFPDLPALQRRRARMDSARQGKAPDRPITVDAETYRKLQKMAKVDGVPIGAIIARFLDDQREQRAGAAPPPAPKPAPKPKKPTAPPSAAKNVN